MHQSVQLKAPTKRCILKVGQEVLLTVHCCRIETKKYVFLKSPNGVIFTDGCHNLCLKR